MILYFLHLEVLIFPHGFGFGDVVIMELLSDLNLIPELPSGVDDIVFAMNEELRGAAMQ